MALSQSNDSLVLPREGGGMLRNDFRQRIKYTKHIFMGNTTSPHAPRGKLLGASDNVVCLQ